MLPSLSTAPAPPPVTARPERFHTNHVTLTGVVQSVWQRYRSDARHAAPPDIMARLAVYDRDAVRRTAAPTRKRPAHYVTLCFPQGETADWRADQSDRQSRDRHQRLPARRSL